MGYTQLTGFTGQLQLSQKQFLNGSTLKMILVMVNDISKPDYMRYKLQLGINKHIQCEM